MTQKQYAPDVPWRLGENRYNDDSAWWMHGTVYDAHNYPVATLHEEDAGPLIAAAPDLLQALQALVALTDGFADGTRGASPSEAHRLWEQARAVILKATGGAV